MLPHPVEPVSSVQVTPDTLSLHAQGLPFLMRQAFRFACKIEFGSLIVKLPDGRAFRFGGTNPGPNAEMILYDFAFAKRMAASGDIGIAESFLRGEWEAADLTVFLQLFCAIGNYSNTGLTGTQNRVQSAIFTPITTLATPSIRAGLIAR